MAMNCRAAQMWGYAVRAESARSMRATHDAAVFEAALRHGIGADGRALYSMPSYNFLRLRDADVADMIAYLRSGPVVPARAARAVAAVGDPLGSRPRRRRGHRGILAQVPPLEHADDADSAHRARRIPGDDHLHRMSWLRAACRCAVRGVDAPDLVVVAGYDEAAFATSCGPATRSVIASCR